MRMTSIAITNMAMFLSFTAPLPIVALIQGKNGEGKSSLLNCVKYAFGRGHDEDIIHAQALEGEILIEFDNGAAVKCRANKEQNETVRSWRAAGSKRFVVSREQIDSISDALSYDPLAFLDKTAKEQLDILLRLMPIATPHEEIARIVPAEEHDQLQNIPDNLNGLQVLALWHKHLYEKRRTLNVAADSHTKHAAQLEQALPPPMVDGADWKHEMTRLEAELAAMEKEQNRKLHGIRDILDNERSEARAAYDDAVLEATRLRDKRIESAHGLADDAEHSLLQSNEAKIAGLRDELATTRERDRALAQAEGTRQAAEQAKANAAEMKSQSERLTTALEQFQTLKENVASTLPMKDITIENGRIYRTENGKLVPFSQWNTEAKMRFCLRIAVLAHGEAGFICIDNAEHFDSEKRAALIQTAERYAERDGLQFLIATVADQPLTMTAAGQA